MNVDPVASSTPPAGGAEQDLFCPACGYNLRGIISPKCPECGSGIDRALAGSRIPWIHRGQIGWLRGYWRTTRMAMLHSGRLADEMARPVDYAQAQRFRCATVFVAALPLILAAWMLRIAVRGLPIPAVPLALDGDKTSWIAETLVIAAVGHSMWWCLALSVLFFFAGISGVQSYLFHPRNLPVLQQNRAVALSYYTSAWLAWSFVPLVAGVAFVWIGTHHRTWFFDLPELRVALLSIAMGGPLVQLFMGWWSTLRLLKGATDANAARRLMSAVALPMMWIAMAVLTLVLFPFLCGHIVLFFYSIG